MRVRGNKEKSISVCTIVMKRRSFASDRYGVSSWGVIPRLLTCVTFDRIAVLADQVKMFSLVDICL